MAEHISDVIKISGLRICEFVKIRLIVVMPSNYLVKAILGHYFCLE